MSRRHPTRRRALAGVDRGGLQVGHAGDWLDGADDEVWEAAPAERRAIAALAWGPRFGDRAQNLVVITHDADPDEIDAWPHEALLTDEELAAGEDAWRELPDPFGWWHTDPRETADVTAVLEEHPDSKEH